MSTTVAVIGGGIGGLTAASDLLAAGHEVVVFEATDRVGGKLRLGTVGDLTVDVGAEAMLALRPEGVDLVTAAGLADHLVHPAPVPATLLVDGRLHAIPRTVMGVPIDPDAALASGVLSQPVVSMPVPLPDHDVSIAEFVGARLGREVVDKLVEPLIGGVYAGRTDHLSVRAAAPMIAALGPDLVVGASSRPPTATGAGPMLAGVSGGMGLLPGALVEVNGIDVRMSTTVRALEHDGARWKLTYGSSATTQTFDAVVVAVPPPAASRLLATVAPKASFALAGVECASMALATFVLDGAQLPPGSGFLVPPTENTTIKAATFASQKWQWLQTAEPDVQVVRTSIGRAGDTAALQVSDDDITAAALADLTRVVSGGADVDGAHLGGADRAGGSVGAVVASSVQRWGGALPQYDVGHLDLVATIERDVAEHRGLAVCGAAYHGVGIPAVIATGHDAARRITATFASTGTLDQEA